MPASAEEGVSKKIYRPVSSYVAVSQVSQGIQIYTYSMFACSVLAAKKSPELFDPSGEIIIVIIPPVFLLVWYCYKL